MVTRVAGTLFGLLLASAPALAQDSTFPKLFAAAATPAELTADSASGAITRVKASKPNTAAKGAHIPVPGVDAALPEVERLAIQADLALIGDYESTAAGEFDGRTVEAVKAFQKRHGGRNSGVLDEEQRAALAAAAKRQQDAVGWQVIDDAATGARLGLPTKLLPHAGTTRTGSRWRSGQVQIETFRLSEGSLQALFDEEKRTAKRSVASSVFKSDSFFISGEQGLKYFTVRADARGTEVRGVTVLYDQATEGIMAGVAVAISDTYQGFPDPNAAPPPGRKRSIEYGTAIAVSSAGEFLAPAHVVDECQSITVAGVGYAEHVAEDKTNELALIRVYGARNIMPAPLDGGSAAGDNLTLIGIADPRVQDGNSVTSVAARASGQNVEPAPKLGFSGAAVIDAQSRFAGVVEVKSPLVASMGPAVASRQAALVPAEAVRAFLTAHGVTPAAGHAAMDQSVARVVCVRK